jgi:hypothetical protein
MLQPNPSYRNYILTIHMKIFMSYSCTRILFVSNHSSMKTGFWAYKILNVKEREQEKNNQEVL